MDRNMKVLMIDSMVGNDYALCLSSSLASSGVDVHLVTTKDREQDPKAKIRLEFWSPAKAASGKLGKTFDYTKYLFQILKFALTNRSAVVHFQFFRRQRFESLFFLLLRALGTNLVYTAHNAVPHESSVVDRLLMSVVYKSSRIIIVHSEFMKHLLIKEFGILSGKVRTIPHGDFDIYINEETLSQNQARSGLGLNNSDHVMLFFGFIREYKGLDLLLDAFDLASQEDPHLKLIIAGAAQSESLEKRYRTRIDRMGAANRIAFHAQFIPAEEVASFFLSSDLVVLPYKNIYHSGVVHVAYSFGRPVVATKVGDFPETVLHGETGFVLEENNAVNLAQTIKAAFSDSVRLDELGHHAKRLSESKYSWNNIAIKTADAYLEMLGEAEGNQYSQDSKQS